MMDKNTRGHLDKRDEELSCSVIPEVLANGWQYILLLLIALFLIIGLIAYTMVGVTLTQIFL